jgi:hypothetical protein
LGSETGFPLWVEEKARIRAFFLSRSALSLFFALFFLHAFALFFRFALTSAKKAPGPTTANSVVISDSFDLALALFPQCGCQINAVSDTADCGSALSDVSLTQNQCCQGEH